MAIPASRLAEQQIRNWIKNQLSLFTLTTPTRLNSSVVGVNWA